jgi:hypothetical protein
MDSYFCSHDLSWKSSIRLWTDDARSVSGKLKGFVALAKQKPLEMFLHTFSYIGRPHFKIISTWGPKITGWNDQNG